MNNIRNIKRSFILTIIFFVFSCSDKDQPDKSEKPGVTSVNEIAKLSTEVSYSKDIIEELSAGLLKAKPEYRAIKEILNGIEETKNDSIRGFENYIRKSENYYASARRFSNQINDSVMRTELLQYIEKSELGFKKRTEPANQVVKLIHQNSARMKDLYRVLIITSTIQQMESSQQRELDTRAIIALLKQQQNLLDKLQTELVKNDYTTAKP